MQQKIKIRSALWLIGLATVVSVLVSIIFFGHGFHLLNIFVAVVAGVVSTVFMVVNYFVAGPRSRWGARTFVGFLYCFVLTTAFISMTAPVAEYPALPHWMHALGWAVFFATTVGAVNWVVEHIRVQ